MFHDSGEWPASKKRRVHFQWGNGDSISYQPRSEKSDLNGPQIETKSWSVSHLNVPMDCPLRRLYTEARDDFLHLQRAMESLQSENTTMGDIDTERQNMLLTIFERMWAAQAACASDDSLSVDRKRLLESGAAYWSFCKVIFLGTESEIILPLMEWIQRRDRDTIKQNMDTHAFGATNWSDDTIWDFVMMLLRRGLFSDAADLLAQHPQGSANDPAGANTPVQIVEKTVRSYPVQVSQKHVNLRDWNLYQEDVDKLIMSRRDIGSDVHLSAILKLLGGSGDVSGCESWMEVVVCRLLFQFPNMPRGKKFKDYAAQWLEEWCPGPKSSADTSYFAPMDEDPLGTLSIASIYGAWFTAHLADLLYHAGKLRDSDSMAHSCSGGPTDVREHYIFEYCVSLMSCEGLWQLAVDYAGECGAFAQGLVVAILERQRPESEKMTRKLINLCQSFDLHTLEKQIARVLSMIKFKKGSQHGSALVWSMRGDQTSGRVVAVATSFLSEAINSGNLTMLHTIAHSVEASAFTKSSVSFFADYVAWRESMESGDSLGAKAALIKLFNSKGLPRQFWVGVLYDALPMLEANDAPAMTAEETNMLLECLEDVCLSHRSSEYLGAPIAKDVDRKIQCIRLALSRSLARGYLVAR